MSENWCIAMILSIAFSFIGVGIGWVVALDDARMEKHKRDGDKRK